MFQSGTATDYLNALDILIALAENRHIATVAVNAAGTGYVVGDVLSISETGGVVEESQSGSLEVTSVGGSGEVTGIRVLNGGAYSTDPTTTTGNTTSGGTGSGCTVDITFADTGWTRDVKQTVDTTETQWIAHGEGDGSDEIYVGIQTYRDTVGGAYFNWELAGMTGYSGSETWETQPGTSVGAIDAFTPVASSAAAAVDFFFFISPYRIIGILNVGSTYTNLHLGFLNRYGTKAQYPYPMYVCGCATRRTREYSTSDEGEGGLVNPVAESGTYPDGPGGIRDLNGAWKVVSNYYGNTGVDRGDRVVWPMGVLDNVTGENNFGNSSFYQTGSSYTFLKSANGAPSGRLIPTEDSGGDITVRIPTLIYMNTPARMIVGEIDGAFVVSGSGGLAPEDTLTDDDGTTYVVFQNCNRTDPWHYFAVRRD